MLQYDLNFNLHRSIYCAHGLQSISYDLDTGKLYVSLQSKNQILIFQASNNETTFTFLTNLFTPDLIQSIEVYLNKIYVGSNSNQISVFNDSNYTLSNTINNICPSSLDYISSIRFDCSGNLIYSCGYSLIVKIKDSNNLDKDILLDGYFDYVGDTLIDSKNRFWIGGNGLIIYD